VRILNKAKSRNYSTLEFYKILDNAFASMKDFKRAKEARLIDDALQDKLMLAVTEVNGCELCKVFHTKNAQKHGISAEEIGFLNTGVITDFDEETEALTFARRYAEKRGTFSQADWKHLNEEYGEKKARGILGAIRVIMMGNTVGIASGDLLKRLKLTPPKGSSFLNEISILLCMVPFLIIIGIKNGLKKLFRKR